MAAGSLRSLMVRVKAENKERPLKTQEIYDLVARAGIAGLDPRAKQDRNLVNRRLPDLSGMGSHSPGRRCRSSTESAGACTTTESRNYPWKRPWCRVPGAGGGVREAAAAAQGVSDAQGVGVSGNPDRAVRGAAGCVPRMRHLPAPLPAV